jgi:hypothetical protein
MTTKFVKPNNDRLFYLFSDKATKQVSGGKVYEYRWDVPDVVLNDWGKISLVNRSFKTFDVNTSPIITRILSINSKDTYDTSRGFGEIIDISIWNNGIQYVNNNPAIDVQPQVINSFTISVNDDMSTNNNGSTESNSFVIVLKLTEGDKETISFGDKNGLNVNQREIPKY